MRGWLRRKARGRWAAWRASSRTEPLPPTRSDRRLDRLPRSMDRVRKLPWLPAALVAAALVTALALAACGEEEHKTGAEGEFIEVGDADYQVQLTRLLNPSSGPTTHSCAGQPKLPPDEAYLAVFVRIENDGDEPHQPPRDMKIIDTQGNEYLPLDTAQSGFGLDFGTRSRPAATRRRRTRRRHSARRRGAGAVPRQAGVGDQQPAAGAGDSRRGPGGALADQAGRLTLSYSSRSLARG